MKLSEKNIQLILILAIVVIAFLAYQFGYVTFKGKADKLSLDNKLTQARILELTNKEAQRSTYVETINGAGEKINEILGKYGPIGSKEKTIMFINRLENDVKASVPSIGFGGDETIYTSTQSDENGLPVIQGYRKQITVEYSCQYANMKKLFAFVNGYPERTNIDSFTMMYNQETGGVSGSMVINQYAVDDANHIYEEPSVTGVPLGKDNIFN